MSATRSGTSPTVTDSSFTVALSLLSTSSRSSTSAAQTFTVQVGNGDHKFKPDVIQAEVGDVVEFDFYPVNHSVIRAEYQHPCIPYEMTGKGKIGFWSGFHAVDAVLDDPPKYTVKINNTDPIFFYCSAPESCTKQGMVGVVNPNSTTSLALQRGLALQASYQLSPGEPFPSEAETPSSSTLPNGTVIQPPASSSSSPAASPSAHGSKLSGGAIAGISVACASVLILGILLAFFWGRLKALKDELRRKDSTVVRSTEPRNTWFLTHSPASPAWGSPSMAQTGPSYGAAAHTDVDRDGGYRDGYRDGDRERERERERDAEFGSPMSSHALPPAYYETMAPYNAASAYAPRSAAHMSRAASHRSVGGTFGWSPATGTYMRTREGAEPESESDADAYADAYAYAYAYTYNKYTPSSSQTLTLTSDMTSPVDPAFAPVSDVQRMKRTPEVREGYIDEKGRLVGRHVNREDPAEMADTSLQDR